MTASSFLFLCNGSPVNVIGSLGIIYTVVTIACVCKQAISVCHVCVRASNSFNFRGLRHVIFTTSDVNESGVM